jgi:NAD(P)-dependent dehydrogenase (short-subunit alcohol dehydrogenase family)
MTEFSRRHLLAGSGALAAAVAVPSSAQTTAAKSLAGKSFLITGTSSGFGNLGALHYARLGARVFATMRNLPRPEGEALARIARDEKLDLHVLPLDVLLEDQVNAAVAEAERRNGGPLDVLVNNAAVFIGGPVEVHDMDAVKLAFDTNLFGYQRTARAVLPGMRAKKSGLIFNVSSQQGRVIMPAMGFYSPTKFAVEAMSEQLAYELAPHGIEVVIIEPGGYPTKIGENRARATAALKEQVPERHAAGYPELVARMAPSPAPATQTPPPAAAFGSATVPDPMDVPKAIAEIAAMPAGSRPLRRPVHPGPKPQLEINRISAETQRALLARGPFAPWAAAVLD